LCSKINCARRVPFLLPAIHPRCVLAWPYTKYYNYGENWCSRYNLSPKNISTTLEWPCVQNGRWSASEGYLVSWATTRWSSTCRSSQTPLQGRTKRRFKGTQYKYGKLGTIDTGACSLALPFPRQTSIFDPNVHHRLQSLPNWSLDTTGKPTEKTNCINNWREHKKFRGHCPRMPPWLWAWVQVNSTKDNNVKCVNRGS